MNLFPHPLRRIIVNRGWSASCYQTNPLISTRLRSRCYGTTVAENKTTLDISHSRFIAEASAKESWDHDDVVHVVEDEMEGVTDTRGKILPTSSHLFKLVLPLPDIKKNIKYRQNINSQSQSPSHPSNIPPTIFLLHPSQPLSHLSRLIAASLSPPTLNPSISYRRQTKSGAYCQWSDSTDVGDFIRDAARAQEFKIYISYDPDTLSSLATNNDQDSSALNLKDEESQSVNLVLENEPKSPSEFESASNPNPNSNSNSNSNSNPNEFILTISVPTFADRTRFLRRRLTFIRQRLEDMAKLKAHCDHEARQGARKMAVGGFGMLVVYWGTVARLTFWDFGWDVMEPITYLSGLSTVIIGYLWFLYQGREVSYTSVFASSLSTRRDALYKAHGFDVDKWMDLLAEQRELKSQVSKIASDYEADEVPDDIDGDGKSDKEPKYKRVSHDGHSTVEGLGEKLI